MTSDSVSDGVVVGMRTRSRMSCGPVPNDRHGHQRGDEVLIKTSEILTRHLRDHDLVARLGGDEFGMAIGGLSTETARRKGESLLQAAAELRRFSGSDQEPLGLSVGVAIFDPSVQESLESLMARADEAMYQVKRGGKHGVALSEPKRSSGGIGDAA